MRNDFKKRSRSIRYKKAVKNLMNNFHVDKIQNLENYYVEMREENRDKIEMQFGRHMTVESLKFLYKKRQKSIENDDLQVKGNIKDKMARFNK